MNILLDITRIWTRSFRATPSGIDRVEYAYAARLACDWPEFLSGGVFTSPVLSGLISPDRVRKLVARVETAWGLTETTAQDSSNCEAVKAWLAAPPDRSRPSAARFRGQSN